MESATDQSSRWSPEMDAAIIAGIQEGVSARIIGERLGVTRNAVLGRTFRLKLCQDYANPRRPETTAVKPKRASLVEKAIERKVIPDEIGERIRDLRELGATWEAVADDLEVSMATARAWAKKLGILEPQEQRRFSPEDRAYIREAWANHVPLEDIAEKLGRSFGVIRQVIFHFKRKGEITTRNPAKTRLLRQYGEDALAAGETPTEALRRIAEAKQIAFAAAVHASTSARRKRYDHAMQAMRDAIAAGMDRNAAIFACRAEGVTLEEIAAEFGVTRERVRQICNAHASVIALQGFRP